MVVSFHSCGATQNLTFLNFIVHRLIIGGLRFHRDYIFYLLLSIFFRQLPSEFAERNTTKTGHMLESECHLKMYVRIWGIPPPKKIGDPKTIFRRFRNLTTTLTANIFGTKTRYTEWDVEDYRSLLHRLKCHELWSTKGLKLDRSLYPSSVNSAFYFTAKLRIRRSANETQPNFAKRRTVNRANNPP